MVGFATFRTGHGSIPIQEAVKANMSTGFVFTDASGRDGRAFTIGTRSIGQTGEDFDVELSKGPFGRSPEEVSFAREEIRESRGPMAPNRLHIGPPLCHA